MKNSYPLSGKIILLFSFLFGFSLFFGQQKSTTLQKLQLNDKVIRSAKQSLEKGKEKNANPNGSTVAKPFTINSKSAKKATSKSNSSRIQQTESTSNKIDQISNNNESPFAAMKGKEEVMAKRDALSKSFKNADYNSGQVVIEQLTTFKKMELAPSFKTPAEPYSVSQRLQNKGKTTVSTADRIIVIQDAGLKEGAVSKPPSSNQPISSIPNSNIPIEAVQPKSKNID